MFQISTVPQLLEYLKIKNTVNTCKQMSRTVSARISNKMHEDIRERCNILGESINDFIAACIELCLYGTADFDFGNEMIEELEKQKSDFEKNSKN